MSKVVTKSIKTQTDLLEKIDLITANKLDPKNLSKVDRNMVIEYLRYEKLFAISKIAELLNCHRDTVRSNLKKIDDSFRTRLISRGYDPWLVIAELTRVKNIIQTKALQNGNLSLVWKSEMDYIDKLVTLGLVKETEQDEMEIEEEYKNMSKRELRELYEKSKLDTGKSPKVKEKEQEL